MRPGETASTAARRSIVLVGLLSLAFGMIACSSAPSGTASDGGPDVKPSSDTGAPDSAETSKPPDAGGDARGAICVFGGDGSSFDKGCVFGP